MPIRITGLNSGLDTDAIVQELVSAHRVKKESYEKKKTKLEWKQDSWKEMNTKIYGFYSKTLSNMRLAGNYTNKKNTFVSDSSKATITADNSVVNGTQTLEVRQLATAAYLTGKEVSGTSGASLNASSKLSELGIADGEKLTLEVGGTRKDIDLTADMTISDLTAKLKAEGVNANFDTKNQRFFISSASTGAANNFAFKSADGTAVDTLKKLGIDTAANHTEAGTVATGGVATKTTATDAEIVLNSQIFTGSSNDFSINGLNITATGVTNGAMTVTTSTDVDGIYNMIKDFVKEYNSLMSAMETAYNAESAKGYEPLTDDQKSEMSDEEVEKWEKKIKDSLLRRDDTLSSIMNSMSMAMTKTYTIDGKKYGLSSFGIKTANYFTRVENESYSYHIDGDEDDSMVEGNSDKLKKAIAEDPDAVMEFFTQLSKDVYNKLDSRMKSTTLSSSYTVYNDKQMEVEAREYQESIKKWEERLLDLEDFYYQKFAAMEAALGELQTKTNSLGSLLGG